MFKDQVNKSRFPTLRGQAHVTPFLMKILNQNLLTFIFTEPLKNLWIFRLNQPVESVRITGITQLQRYISNSFSSLKWRFKVLKSILLVVSFWFKTGWTSMTSIGSWSEKFTIKLFSCIVGWIIVLLKNASIGRLWAF